MFVVPANQQYSIIPDDPKKTHFWVSDGREGGCVLRDARVDISKNTVHELRFIAKAAGLPVSPRQSKAPLVAGVTAFVRFE